MSIHCTVKLIVTHVYGEIADESESPAKFFTNPCKHLGF